MFDKKHKDINRSKMSAFIYKEAMKNEFFLYHFEYRYLIDQPTEWQVNSDVTQSWANGIFRENKYQHFTNDLRIGSFNPGHSSKWTAHELCHLLSGFAWNSNFNEFDIAISARLAELIPVLVYYFWDDAYSKRCERHREKPAYGKLCFDCEKLAVTDLNDPIADRLMKEGKAFFQNEMTSIKKSIKEKSFDYNPHWNIDLMSDAITYTKHQAKRLSSPVFNEFMEMFHPEDTGHFLSIDDYVSHIETMFNRMESQKNLDRFSGNRSLWISQDIAWRLIMFKENSNSEKVKDEMTELIESIADNKSVEAIEMCIERYWELYNLNDSDFLHPDMIFGVGYRLNNEVGKSFSMIESGLLSCIEPALQYINLKHDIDCFEMIVNFISADEYEREFLAGRFLKFSDKYLNGFFSEATKSLEIVTALASPDKWDYQDFIQINGELDEQDVLNPTLGVFKVDPEMNTYLKLQEYFPVLEDLDQRSSGDLENKIDDYEDSAYTISDEEEIIDLFGEENNLESEMKENLPDEPVYIAIYTDIFGKKNILEITENLYTIIISLRAGQDVDISDEELSLLIESGMLLRKVH